MRQVRALALTAEGVDEPGSPAWSCRRALAGRCAVVVGEWGPAEAGPVDLALAVGDPPGWAGERPGAVTAWWALGWGGDLAALATWADRFDHVFVPDRALAREAREAGLTPCRWLAEAVDPEVHGRRAAPPERDVAWVGTVEPDDAELLARLRATYPGVAAEAAGWLDPTRLDATSRVVVHSGLDRGADGRLFEALARGATLVMRRPDDDPPGARLVAGIHAEMWRTSDELLDRVARCLDDPDHARRLAAFGRREVLANQTYAARLRTLLEVVGTRSDRTRPDWT